MKGGAGGAEGDGGAGGGELEGWRLEGWRLEALGSTAVFFVAVSAVHGSHGSFVRAVPGGSVPVCGSVRGFPVNPKPDFQRETGSLMKVLFQQQHVDSSCALRAWGSGSWA